MQIVTAEQAAEFLNRTWPLAAANPSNQMRVMAAVIGRTADHSAFVPWEETTAAASWSIHDPLPPVLRVNGTEVVARPVVPELRDTLTVSHPEQWRGVGDQQIRALQSAAIGVLTARRLADELDRIGVPGKHRQMNRELSDLRTWADGMESRLPVLARPAVAHIAASIGDLAPRKRATRRTHTRVPVSLR